MRKTVSILHHSIPSTSPQRIAEEENLGWHFRIALALRNYKGYIVVCVRPSGDKRTVIKYVERIPVVLLPTAKMSISDRLWRWSEVSPSMSEYVSKLVTKHGFIPYIHEYRSLNSELIIRKLIEYPMILQHHGSLPPNFRDTLSINPLKLVKLAKELSKAKRATLKKVRGAIFVLNKAEKEYLEALGVEAYVKIRTMAADFNKLRLISEEKKNRLRRELKILENSIVLTSYVGVFREEFSSIKGAHLIAKVWKILRSNTKSL